MARPPEPQDPYYQQVGEAKPSNIPVLLNPSLNPTHKAAHKGSPPNAVYAQDPQNHEIGVDPPLNPIPLWAMALTMMRKTLRTMRYE